MGADPCCCLVTTVDGGDGQVATGSARLAALGLRVVRAGRRGRRQRLLVYARDEASLEWARISVEEAFGDRLVACRDLALSLRADGMVQIEGRQPLQSAGDLALVYTPGVARIAVRISADAEAARELTGRARTVAVVGDGSDVLGCGEIRPVAALPVLEGLAAALVRFGGVDAVPLAIERGGTHRTAEVVTAIGPSFGAVVLAGMATPRGPLLAATVAERGGNVVGDWQALAVAAGAAVINALQIAGSVPQQARVVIRGANSVCVALAPLLGALGIGDVIVLHRGRVLGSDGPGGPSHLGTLALSTNPNRITGGLQEAARGAAVLVDLEGEVIPEGVLARMESPRALLLLATTSPDVFTRQVPGTLLASRSPLGPNWVDPALVLPGLVRGLLARPTAVTGPLLVRLARALADAATPVRPSRLLPNPFDLKLPALLANEVGNPQRPGASGPPGYPFETPTWPAIETGREVPRT